MKIFKGLLTGLIFACAPVCAINKKIVRDLRNQFTTLSKQAPSAKQANAMQKIILELRKMKQRDLAEELHVLLHPSASQRARSCKTAQARKKSACKPVQKVAKVRTKKKSKKGVKLAKKTRVKSPKKRIGVFENWKVAWNKRKVKNQKVKEQKFLQDKELRAVRVAKRREKKNQRLAAREFKRTEKVARAKANSFARRGLRVAQNDNQVCDSIALRNDRRASRFNRRKELVAQRYNSTDTRQEPWSNVSQYVSPKLFTALPDQVKIEYDMLIALAKENGRTDNEILCAVNSWLHEDAPTLSVAHGAHKPVIAQPPTTRAVHAVDAQSVSVAQKPVSSEKKAVQRLAKQDVQEQAPVGLEESIAKLVRKSSREKLAFKDNENAEEELRRLMHLVTKNEQEKEESSVRSGAQERMLFDYIPKETVAQLNETARGEYLDLIVNAREYEASDDEIQVLVDRVLANDDRLKKDFSHHHGVRGGAFRQAVEVEGVKTKKRRKKR